MIMVVLASDSPYVIKMMHAAAKLKMSAKFGRYLEEEKDGSRARQDTVGTTLFIE